MTKRQSLVRLPWLGYTMLGRRDYTNTNADTPGQQRILRDICRWHVEEFAYLIGKLKAAPEETARSSTTAVCSPSTSTPKRIGTTTTASQ